MHDVCTSVCVLAMCICLSVTDSPSFWMYLANAIFNFSSFTILLLITPHLSLHLGYPTISRSQDVIFCSWNCAKEWNHANSHAIIKQRTEDMISLEEEKEREEDEHGHGGGMRNGNDTDDHREEHHHDPDLQQQQQHHGEEDKIRPITAH